MDNTRKKLKKKIKSKREARNGAGPSSSVNPFPEDILSGEPDILKMMDRVNKILKTNPQMINQISKCVSNVMNNQDLMNSLAGQLEKTTVQEQFIEPVQDQTLDNNDDDDNFTALSKESKQ